VQPCRYFLLSGPKNGFFAPQRRHVASINVKFGTEEQTAGTLPFVKFQIYRGRNVGIQPPELSKFRILAINLCLRGDSFAVFLRNSQRLYASIGSFYVFSLVACILLSNYLLLLIDLGQLSTKYDSQFIYTVFRKKHPLLFYCITLRKSN